MGIGAGEFNHRKSPTMCLEFVHMLVFGNNDDKENPKVITAIKLATLLDERAKQEERSIQKTVLNSSF